MKKSVGVIIVFVAAAITSLGLYYYNSQQEISSRNEALRVLSEQSQKALADKAERDRKALEERKQKEEAERIAKIRRDPSDIGVLVNKKHPLVPMNYEPSDLVTVNGATLSSKASEDFKKMFAKAASDGQPFYVTSSYRSYGSQVSTYNHWVKTSGQFEADTYSARPGYSEHQTGLVVDVAANGCALSCFGSTSQYKWFQENAAQFGFIQRYNVGEESLTGYKSEEWHYRYVGVEVAEDMKSKGIKSLETYWNIPGGDYASAS